MLHITNQRESRPANVRDQRSATYMLFLCQGLLALSWLPHTPSIVARAGLTDAQLGLGFGGMGIAAVITIPSLGPVIARYGLRSVATVAISLLGTSVVAVGFVDNFASFLAVVFAAGCAASACEVCGATSGGRLEEFYNRPLMPSFIGLLTLGMLTGGTLSALSIPAGVPSTTYLVVVGSAVAVFGLFATPRWS